MLHIKIPIDDYVDTTFKSRKEDMIILPRRVNNNENSLEITLDLEDEEEKLSNIDGELLSALTDGYANGFIEGLKYVSKNLIKEDFTDSFIMKMTGFSNKSIIYIKEELANEG